MNRGAFWLYPGRLRTFTVSIGTHSRPNKKWISQVYPQAEAELLLYAYTCYEFRPEILPNNLLAPSSSSEESLVIETERQAVELLDECIDQLESMRYASIYLLFSA